MSFLCSLNHLCRPPVAVLVIMIMSNLWTMDGAAIISDSVRRSLQMTTTGLTLALTLMQIPKPSTS
jgi:hypothetical protein